MLPRALVLSSFWLSSSHATFIPSAASALLVKEQTSLPTGWTQLSTPPLPNSSFVLRIGLAQSNFAGLEASLLAVSDPSNPLYGQHLSKDEVLSFLTPTAATTNAVDTWLASHNITPTEISPAKDWYTINTTLSRIENLLQANFSIYEGGELNYQIVRTTSYQIPASLDAHIDTIQPTTIFPSGKATYSTSFKSLTKRNALVKRPVPIYPYQYENCTSTYDAVVPNWCVRQIYNVGNYTPLANLSNSIGVAGYLGQHAQRSDLTQYLQLYLPEAAAANYTFSIESPLGTDVPQGVLYGNTEANLDTQTVAGLVYPIPSIFYSVDSEPPINPDDNTDSDTNEPYLVLQNYLLGNSDIPTVLTTSYGDDEQSVPFGYADRVCKGYAALGARGVSVIFSSGDMGVGPYADEYINSCIANDGTNRTLFVPSFPATCPYVTTVGETGNLFPEVASTGSSGGFSRYFSRPSYQDTAVSKYLSWWGSTYSEYFNRDGRAFPDLTSHGSYMPLYDYDLWTLTFGTSCAAPTVASLVSLLNDHRLRNGGKTLGFLNPLLYSSKAQGAYTDITAGNNPGCGTNGFNATQGWDPISGLGTLNFGKMKDVIGPSSTP